MEHTTIRKDRSWQRGLARRREAAARKVRKRSQMMRDYGKQGGLIYERHRQKIDQSLGYMRDGNVSHYVSVGFRPKTKDRDRYGPARRLSRHDTRLEDALREQEDFYD